MNLVKFAATALLIAAPSAAFAQAADSAASPPVTCMVQGHDLVLFNRTAAPLAAGTPIHWSVHFSRQEGTHTLEAALEPGIGLYLDSALRDYVWDRPCVAALQ